MKPLLLIWTLTIAAAAHAESGSLAGHMREMSREFAMAKSLSGSEDTYSQAGTHSRRLRGHAIASIALKPRAVNERDMIEYHQLMSRLIYMAASLEEAFANEEDYTSISVSREMDIESLFREIEKLMAYAHERYGREGTFGMSNSSSRPPRFTRSLRS